jgi:transposase
MIAEHGIDMTRFGTAARLAAWSSLAPGNNESAGKHRRRGARTGNRRLKTALYIAAVSAGRTKDTYLCDKYHRIKARGGPGRAAAHKIVIAAFHILTTGKPYHDLGGDYLDKRTQRRTQQRLVQRLQRMGYYVTLQPVAA